MSKINELRKKAVDAARKRDWSGAVKLYERVCEIDTNNPGFRNELGDIFVKLNQVNDALLAFAKAAEAYRGVGLHNNAIAVYKKILRHEPTNLDALWGLGEVKEQQGLETDAASHYVDFLARHRDVPGSTKQQFVNRCLLLIERYDDDLQMLSRVEKVFEHWKLGEDHARVLIQKARLARSEGQDELIEKYVARAREVFEDLDLLDDYVQLRREMDGEAPTDSPEPAAELDIADASIEADAELAEPNAEFESVIASETEPEVVADDDVSPPPAAPPTKAKTTQPKAPRASAELDLGFDLEPSATRDAPSAAAPADKVEIRSLTQELSRAMAQGPTPPQRTPPAAETKQPPVPEPPALNALDALLSDSKYDVRAAESGQFDTIEADVGAQLAGQLAEDDFQGQYDVGIVYLDMGMHDSAIEAFERAARGPEQRLKALEMRGNVLRQIGRNADALSAYQEGLHTLGQPARAYLGLLYETGACLLELGQAEDALYHFEQAAKIDADFLDVRERIRQLTASTAR